MHIDEALRHAAARATEERHKEDLAAGAAGIALRRATVTAEVIRAITDAAISETRTQADIATKFGVSQCAVAKYKTHFQRFSSYFLPARRGPKLLVDEATREYISKLCSRLRVLGYPITPERFRYLARGAMRRLHGNSSVTPIPALNEFSVNWATQELARMGWERCCATTDRTVPPSQIVPAGVEFYKTLSDLHEELDLDRRLVFNVDEWFFLLTETNGWTYTRPRPKGQRHNVAVASDKLGFTSSAMTSACGAFHLLQIIWKGKTADVHAKVDEEKANKRIVQMHRPESHFQCAETWRGFIDHFVSYVDPLRKSIAAELGRPTEAVKVLLLVDAATVHEYRPPVPWLLFAGIPPSMTHVYQPADQTIIATLKKKARASYAKWLEDVVRQYEPTEAALILAGKKTPPADPRTGGAPNWAKLPFKKHVKYLCLSEAVNAISRETVLVSWAMTGILRAIWGTTVCHESAHRRGQPVEVLFDQYVAALEDEKMLLDMEELGVEDFDEVVAVNPKPTVIRRQNEDEPDPRPPTEAPATKRGKGRPPKLAAHLVPAPGQTTLDRFMKRQREE